MRLERGPVERDVVKGRKINCVVDVSTGSVWDSVEVKEKEF